MERSVDGEVIASTFDESAACHTRQVADMFLEKRSGWSKGAPTSSCCSTR